MKEKIGIGIIGLGIMGKFFSQIVKEHPMAELIAIADIDKNKIDKLTRKFSIKGFTDYEELLQNESIQAVFICLPEQSHTLPALAAASAGKHLFIEKPIAIEVCDADTIISAAKTAKVKLMVGHCLRFDPRFALAKNAIEQGEIGDIIHIYIRRNSYISTAKRLQGRTSLIMFLGIHDVDIVNWYIKDVARRVFAESSRVLLRNLGIDDSVFSTIKFENGAVAVVENSWALCDKSRGIAANSTMEVEIVGTQGTIFVDGSMNTGLRLQGKSGVQYPDTMYFASLQGKIIGVYEREVSHFIDCISSNKEPATSGEDAKKALIIVDAISKSLKNKTIIEL